MSSTCIPNVIRHDQRFRSMQPRLRCAAIDMIGDLQLVGDGKLSDDQLRAGRCGPTGMASVTAVFLAAGWFARAVDGKLGRAGVLAADDGVEQSDSDRGVVSASAARMRENRLLDRVTALLDGRLAPIEQHLGISTERTSSVRGAHKSAHNGAQIPRQDPAMREQSPRESLHGSAQPGPAPSRNSNSEFIPNSSHKCEKNSEFDTNSDSNSAGAETIDQTPERTEHQRTANESHRLTTSDPVKTFFDPPNRMSPPPSRAQVIAALVHFGFTEGDANKALQSKSIPDIAAGIDCLQRGFWAKSTSDKGTLRNYLFKKLTLNSAYIREHVQPLQPRQESAVMSVDTTPPDPILQGLRAVRESIRPVPAVAPDRKQGAG